MKKQRRRSWPAVGMTCALAMGTSAFAAPLPLTPQYAGPTTAGGGVEAQFAQIDSSWHGSTVLWDEASKQYGVGEPIGSYAWGTGIWGRADFDAVQAAALNPGVPGAPVVTHRWSGPVPTINFANSIYNTDYSARWGMADLVPMFDNAQPTEAQENWTAHFTGYLRVTNPGAYSFGVLNDDGFFFRLIGGDATWEAGRDFLNPRDRDGFANDVLLSEGLYGIELGMWNRLEAGVVDLRWSQDGGNTWLLVPTGNLAPPGTAPQRPALVPLPGTLALIALPLAGLLLRRRGA